MKLNVLANEIKAINESLQQSAAKAINKHVTARNWLIGYCIVNYEQHGEDRAAYGERTLQALAEKIGQDGLSYSNLKSYRQFYLAFPELSASVSRFLVSENRIGQPVVGQFQLSINEINTIGQPVVAQLKSEELISPEEVFSSLSYTHLAQLMSITDPVEKAFYEIQSIKGVWSKRELKRQIESNLYLRTGLSRNKDLSVEKANVGAEKTDIRDVIRSPYTFEFLGLKSKEVVEESDLESALMDHLQDFMLELGNGFCFEARQKRIVIDDKYYFYDLLFYNRILHCGVIIELKSKELDYADMAQLNMYVNYYRANMMNEGDNPPVGILLCTEAGQEMVQYTSPGIDENVFVSTYMLHLPDREQILDWLRRESCRNT